MTDVLLEIGTNPTARKLIRSLGLPLPLPEKLARDRGPSRARPLDNRKVVIGATEGAELVATIAECLAPAGAEPYTSSDLAPAFRDPGETFGRPARSIDTLGETAKVHALVFDATGISTISGLNAMYAFFQPLVSKLARSGRVVVLTRPSSKTAEASAAQQAVEGFVRSVAKEIGRGGATANVVVVSRGAELRVAAVLRYVLSARAAFVTGQPILIDDRAKAIAEPPLVRPLEQKIALVTGAARGIGAATARALAQEGAHVICLDRPADDGAVSQLAREIGGSVVLADLTAEGAIEKVVAAVKARGGLDIVVHNAGITRDKTLARMKPEQWSSVLDINLRAVVDATAALEPLLRENGRIVCLSSIAGLAGNMGQAAYAASKAGIVGWVRAEAERFAARGITVNAIAPGFIETRLTAAIPLAIREVARRLSALGQGGLPEDVAQAITFLATPGAQGLTGRTLRVCGGAFVGA